jgi:hypothetical protein
MLIDSLIAKKVWVKSYVTGEIAALPKPMIMKGTIAVAGDFPTTADVLNGWVYKVTANVTDNNPAKTNTGLSFLAGDEICWIEELDTWVDLGSDALFVRDDATDTLSPANANDNLDLGSGDFITTGDVDAGTHSSLTLTPLATGFSVAGGTAPKTLTLDIDLTASAIDNSKWETEGTAYIKPKSSKKVLSIYTEFVPPDDIGRPYQRNFGVGYPATLPDGFVALPGSYDPYCPDFGNFLDTKGNECVYVPPFWAKRDETSYGGNLATLVKPLSAYATEAAANADGYYMPDGFFKGTEICGIFFFKYLASKITDGAGFSAGSRRFGLPISTNADHNPIADLTACTTNAYFQALNAVKAIDGVDGAVNPSSKWFVPCLQQLAILALLTQAQARDDIYCAWRDATKPYPRGNNNSALSDETDTSIKFISDGYPNCSKTGSADQFAKTTHNGRANGISDINGPMWWISPGLTCIATSVNISGISQANPGQVTTASNHGLVNGDKILITGVVGMTQANDKLYEVTRIDDTNFTIGVDTAGWTAYASGGVIRTGTYYVKKRSYDPTLYTSGNSGANDAWGATGVANWGEVLNIAIPVGGASVAQRYGKSTNVVLGNLSDRLSNIGFPKDTNAISTGGTDLWGKDYYYLYFLNECCPLRFGTWSYGSYAGVWGVYLYGGSSSSYTGAGFSACAFGTPVL